MEIRRLDPDTENRLRAADLSYSEVGRTAGPLPEGYATTVRSGKLARRDFDQAGRELLAWQVQLRSGIRVAASSPNVAEGSVALLRIGPGPLAVRAPCRVVYVLDEPRRRGFAYGTLPGHPEAGEEAFVLELRDDGGIEFTITAFSRHASVPARLGGPVARAVQHMMTTRYLNALDR